jgi:uncharacterized membrane protein
MYEALVLVHVLSAMVWVGGGFVLMTVERHAQKTGGQTMLVRTMADLEWVDDWIFTPAPLLVIASGVTMVILSDAWAFSQPWIYLALALIVIEFVAGYRDLDRLKKGREAGVETPEFAAALKAYMRFAPLAIALLGAVVVLMVFKPGV